ncbi:MAG: endonuclease [Nitrospirae bacterium]|nr:endonuclease [Nitrospirota bacterium]
MKIPPWPGTISEAKAAQVALRDKVRIVPLRKKTRYIAAVDAAFAGERIIGAACLYRYPEITLVEETHAEMRNLFPYVPGLLTFREGPVITKVIGQLTINPDVILFDGQGIAHPISMGIASHMGVILDLPAIGCAKSRLIGDYKEPKLRRGSWSPLLYNDTVVGAVLRTRDNVKPIFVSPGHRIDLKSSIDIVLTCISKYRIPEPLRRADFLSKRIKREKEPHFSKGG